MSGIYTYLIKALFFSKRFYFIFLSIICLFVLSYSFSFLMPVAQLLVLVFAGMVLLDYLFLFFKRDALTVKREVAERFSNADDNVVAIIVTNHFAFWLRARVIDEVPEQFQWRNFSLNARLGPGAEVKLSYSLHPLSRGEYFFRAVNLFIQSPLGLVVRRIVTGAETMVKVYPSFFALRRFTLGTLPSYNAEAGNKRTRKMGQSLEFEQIKEYVQGDDIRTINWNATARRGGQLMLNSYTDERSQQVYCMIDQGRVMKMPFEGMTLLDYAINASVLLSHVALLKQDKAGLVTFANTIDTYLQAGKKAGQMNNIVETLYAQQADFLETDFEKLYATIRTKITQRSLLLLFTNFESLSGMQRQLPYIQRIAKNHLLIVVFFENTELEQLSTINVENTEDLYVKTIAEKFIQEKRLIVKELRKHGIMSILTSPKNLSVNVINKYLEIKSRQAI